MLRFRPIMMTTLAALFGALPLALERGTGSELRFPLGVTIIGGLLLSQLLTLYTTPVIYLAMERLKARLQRATRPPPAPPLPRAAPAAGPPRAGDAADLHAAGRGMRRAQRTLHSPLPACGERSAAK